MGHRFQVSGTRQRKWDVQSKLQEKQRRMDQLFMDIAFRISDESVDYRRRVGCVIVKDGAIISMGWNGTPEGFDNACTGYHLVQEDGVLHLRGLSKPTVAHAEMNALTKLLRSTSSAVGSTLYCTDQPCLPCAMVIAASKPERVVYAKPYRVIDGVEHLQQRGILVQGL